MRRVLGVAFLVGGVLGAGLATAQDGAKPATPAPAAADPTALVRDLGHADFTVRQRAEEALVAMGARALPTLEQASSSPDAEVAFRARRAVRRIREGDRGVTRRPAAPAQPGQPAPGDGDRPGREPFPRGEAEDAIRRLLRDFGFDDARGGTEPGGRDGWGDWEERFRREMDEMRERHRRMMRDVFGEDDPGFPGLPGLGGEPGAPDGRAEDPFAWMDRLLEGRGLRLPRIGVPGGAGGGVQIEIGPDGMKMSREIREGDRTIRATRDGEKIRIEVVSPDGTKVYEAETEAELREKHPEAVPYLERTLGGMRIFGGGPGGQGGLRFRFGGGSQREDAPAPLQHPRPAHRAKSAALGAWVEPASAVVRAQLGLPEGQGCFLQAVEPDGWAARAGLERYDVVLLAGGTPVQDAAGLDAAHAAATETLRLEIIRRGERRVIEARK